MRTNQERSALEWDQQSNPGYDTCITSYTVSWNGMSYDTPNTNTMVSAGQLTGFPFCQDTLVTVIPVTGIGPLTGASASSIVTLIDPGTGMMLSLQHSRGGWSHVIRGQRTFNCSNREAHRPYDEP